MLPVGPQERDQTATDFTRNHPHPAIRSIESLRRKFNGLNQNKAETGDHTCPPMVCRATHIYNRMLEKINAAPMGDSKDECIDGS